MSRRGGRGRGDASLSRAWRRDDDGRLAHAGGGRGRRKGAMTMARLAGKIALVTGAGSGIGRGCALHLAREGAAVAVLDRDSAGGQGTVAQIEEAGGSALLL